MVAHVTTTMGSLSATVNLALVAYDVRRTPIIVYRTPVRTVARVLMVLTILVASVLLVTLELSVRFPTSAPTTRA